MMKRARKRGAPVGGHPDNFEYERFFFWVPILFSLEDIHSEAKYPSSKSVFLLFCALKTILNPKTIFSMLAMTAVWFWRCFKGDTPDRTPQVGFCGCCLIGAIGMSLSDKSMIFGSGKSWNVGLNHEKVFYPLRKFFTPFLGTWCYKSYFQILQFFWFSWGQKGGKKLFDGVKNFSISKYAISTFTWIKN